LGGEAYLDRHALDSNEFRCALRLSVNVKAQGDGLSDALLKLVERLGLGVAAGQCGNRGDVEPVFIALDDHAEFALGWPFHGGGMAKKCRTGKVAETLWLPPVTAVVDDGRRRRGLRSEYSDRRATGLWSPEFTETYSTKVRLMTPPSTVAKMIFVGLDVHAESIAVAIADPSGEVRSYGNIPAHTHAVDRLHKRLSADGTVVHYVYEAGPTGFALCRHLRAKGIDCQVVCPSLVPKRPSDRIKTDRRDATALARLFRAGELTFIRVPEPVDEAIRDLVRARQAAVEDLRRCRQRIKAFLLRHGRRYSGKTSWTEEHLNYLSRQVFDFPAQRIAFEELVRAVADPDARVERLTSAIEEQVRHWDRYALVKALMCLRGISLLNATTLVCEIGDFSRFDHPSKLMGFIGITPSEDTSGQRRHLGSITRAGNHACRRTLVEAAWHYRLPACISQSIRARQHGQPKAITDIAWKAQIRLCGRYRALVARHKKSVVAVVAVARELAGFVWAIAQALEGRAIPARKSPTTIGNPTKRSSPVQPTSKGGARTPKAPTRDYILQPPRPFKGSKSRVESQDSAKRRPAKRAPIRTGAASSLRVATGGDAS
jgi:transposase